MILAFSVLFSSLTIITSPPSQLQAFDTPNDEGHSITLKWERPQENESVKSYEIYRSEALEGDYAARRRELEAQALKYVDAAVRLGKGVVLSESGVCTRSGPAIQAGRRVPGPQGRSVHGAAGELSHASGP